MSKVTTIDAAEARRLMAEGASLVDIRELDEHAREHIAEALHCPLSEVEKRRLPDGRLIFHCRSGNRTAMHADRLAAAGREVYLLGGGIEGWRKAGLPTVRDVKQPIELMRQVQIAAGGLAFAGTLLGLTVSPWFFGVPLFVGAGLTFAGATGFCGMARLLMLAPWNKPLRSRAGA